jgi:hypothetical protein
VSAIGGGAAEPWPHPSIAPRHDQREYRYAPLLGVNRELESIGQQGPQHESNLLRRGLHSSRGDDIEASGANPIRTADQLRIGKR